MTPQAIYWCLYACMNGHELASQDRCVFALQDVVKGSQGAGKVDDSLDRTKMEVDAPEGPSKAGPRAQPGLARRRGAADCLLALCPWARG